MSTRDRGATDPLYDPTNSTFATRIKMLNSSGAGTSHAVQHSESESENEDLQDQITERQNDFADYLVRTVSRMGIKAPKPFDQKRDNNFGMWLERTEFHLTVNKCQEDDKPSLLLLLLDVDSFEAATHIGIKPNTPYAKAKQKLKDYFAITETKEELREKLDLRQQEAGETIEAYARDIKLIGHKAYPDGEPRLLESVLIKVFINGLRDDTSRERVLLYKPKTLTDAAQYARFSETAIRVARGQSKVNATSVSAVNYTNQVRGNGNSNRGYRGNWNYSKFRKRDHGPFRC